MSNSESLKPDIVFIDVPQIVTAKIVRERVWHFPLPSEFSWRGKLALAACVLLLAMMGWSTFRNRFFLPELMAVGLLTLTGLLGVSLLIKNSRTFRSSFVGILLLSAWLLGFAVICLPAVQRGYARSHLVKTIRSQGLDFDVAGEGFMQSSGWLKVRNDLLVPRLLVELIGGPAMLMPIERIELPQDMVTSQVVDALREPTAKYAPVVSLLASKLRRPPDADSFQKLLNTVNLWSVDATWFDAETFRMLNSSAQRVQMIEFDGRLTRDAIEGISQFNTTSYPYLRLKNMGPSQLGELSRLSSMSNTRPFYFRSFTLNDCTLTHETAKMLATLNYPLSFEDFEPENIYLAAAHGARLHYFAWQGKFTKQTAESFAKSVFVSRIMGTIEPEEGAIEALSQSATLQSFSIAKTLVKNEDIEYLLRMPALYQVHFENCAADFEMLQRLAAKPGMNTITITNGTLTPVQLQKLQKATATGNARLYQTNFVANPSQKSPE